MLATPAFVIRPITEKGFCFQERYALTQLQSAGLQLPMETTANEGGSIINISNKTDPAKSQTFLGGLLRRIFGSVAD